MPVDKQKKLSRRIRLGRGVRLLRERLDISQERLAAMLGEEVTAASVSRWERGVMLPYPRTQQKLRQIALENKQYALACVFGGEVNLDDFLNAFSLNASKEYNDWMAVTMCALHAWAFMPNNPEEPTREEVGVANAHREMMATAQDLVARLAALHEAGEPIEPPPHAAFGTYWDAYLEKRRRHAEIETTR